MIVPPRKPQLDLARAVANISANDVRDKVVLLGIRGYYADTMGRPGVNDIGIYDDAIALVAPEAYATFNANVDPGRLGFNPNVGKQYAQLVPGVWRYKIGRHKNSYTALIQAAAVRVFRGDQQETGWFGINIHKGGYERVSSEGCQTIYPDQWLSFINLVVDQMDRYNQEEIPYILVQNA